MKISTEQLNAVRALQADAPATEKVDTAVIRLMDRDLILKTTGAVQGMGDREEMIRDLKARIDEGTYNPSSDDIADAIMRRAAADKIS